MANFTKKAIKNSFIKLLNERPLNAITVKDIVDDCGINRNTFYYHFNDIPSLLQEIITEEADQIIQQYPSIDSLEKCLEVALKFALQNKRAVMHIHNSVNRDLYEDYLLRICEYVVTQYVNSLSANASISESDKRLLIRLFKCECFGIILDWIRRGMKEDILVDFHRLCELRVQTDGSLVQQLIKGNPY